MAPWPGFFSRLGARLPSSSQLSLEGDMLGNPQKYRHINIGKAETKTKTLQRLENQSLSLSLSMLSKEKVVLSGGWLISLGPAAWVVPTHGDVDLLGPLQNLHFFLKLTNVSGGLSFWDTLIWGIIPCGHIVVCVLTQAFLIFWPSETHMVLP